jgi:hypothetical protein
MRVSRNNFKYPYLSTVVSLFCIFNMFRSLGTSITSEDCIHKDINSRLKFGNDCYHSVKNLLSSCLNTEKCKN